MRKRFLSFFRCMTYVKVNGLALPLFFLLSSLQVLAASPTETVDEILTHLEQRGTGWRSNNHALGALSELDLSGPENQTLRDSIYSRLVGYFFERPDSMYGYREWVEERRLSFFLNNPHFTKEEKLSILLDNLRRYQHLDSYWFDRVAKSFRDFEYLDSSAIESLSKLVAFHIRDSGSDVRRAEELMNLLFLVIEKCGDKGGATFARNPHFQEIVHVFLSWEQNMKRERIGAAPHYSTVLYIRRILERTIPHGTLSEIENQYLDLKVGSLADLSSTKVDAVSAAVNRIEEHLRRFPNTRLTPQLLDQLEKILSENALSTSANGSLRVILQWQVRGHFSEVFERDLETSQISLCLRLLRDLGKIRVVE